MGDSYGARDLQTFGPFQCHVARAVLCIPFLFLYLVKTRWHHGFLDPTKTRFFFLGAKLAGKVPVGLLLPQLRSRSGTEAYHRRISFFFIIITEESREHDVDRGDYDDP